MTFYEFKRKLKKLNPNIEIIRGPLKVFGVYIKQKQMGEDDVESNKADLAHICGMPSSRVFLNLPKYDFWEQPWNKYGIKIGKPEFHRGWKTVVSLLASKGFFKAADAKRTFNLVSL